MPTETPCQSPQAGSCTARVRASRSSATVKDASRRSPIRWDERCTTRTTLAATSPRSRRAPATSSHMPTVQSSGWRRSRTAWVRCCSGPTTRATVDSLRHRMPMARVWRITYDLRAATTTVTDRTMGSRRTRYDSRGNVTHETDALGRGTALTYGAFDTLLSTVDALGHTTTSTYDDQGNLLTTRDPLGHVTSYTYDASRSGPHHDGSARADEHEHV